MSTVSDSIVKQTFLSNIIVTVFNNIKKTVAEGANSENNFNTKIESLEANYKNFCLNDRKLSKYEFAKMKDHEYFSGIFLRL